MFKKTKLISEWAVRYFKHRKQWSTVGDTNKLDKSAIAIIYKFPNQYKFNKKRNCFASNLLHLLTTKWWDLRFAFSVTFDCCVFQCESNLNTQRILYKKCQLNLKTNFLRTVLFPCAAIFWHGVWLRSSNYFVRKLA